MSVRRARAAGALVGLACGDALGAGYEFAVASRTELTRIRQRLEQAGAIGW